jgi:uncharacterized protein
MAEEDIEALRRVYDEWGTGNFRPVTDVYGADMEWGWSDEFLDLAGVTRGSEGPSDRLLGWLDQWEHWRVEAEEFILAGDFVVVMCRYIGRGKGSGVDVDTQGAHVWKIRNGRATRLEVFSDRTKALESAGVRREEVDGP